jgi:hypothetical protein
VERSDLESYAVKLSLLHASHPEPGDSLQASFDAMYGRLLEDLSPLERCYLIDEVALPYRLVSMR